MGNVSGDGGHSIATLDFWMVEITRRPSRSSVGPGGQTLDLETFEKAAAAAPEVGMFPSAAVGRNTQISPGYLGRDAPPPHPPQTCQSARLHCCLHMKP
ncbi:hypothetical protein EYF80_040272 [Liparis tanakae]|uniref:Uncharacterized protein n=1 Tax=Liparis tanakae TaxID=230148 RepID=A0A4Z2GAC6_9TELE|nr:hypothetical protein EYF80_040272 [Liparis tanakae]